MLRNHHRRNLCRQSTSVDLIFKISFRAAGAEGRSHFAGALVNPDRLDLDAMGESDRRVDGHFRHRWRNRDESGKQDLRIAGTGKAARPFPHPFSLSRMAARAILEA